MLLQLYPLSKKSAHFNGGTVSLMILPCTIESVSIDVWQCAEKYKGDIEENCGI